MALNAVSISASVVGIPLSRNTCSKSTVGFSVIVHSLANLAEIVGFGSDVKARQAFFGDHNRAGYQAGVTFYQQGQLREDVAAHGRAAFAYQFGGAAAVVAQLRLVAAVEREIPASNQQINVNLGVAHPAFISCHSASWPGVMPFGALM